jgi:serine/threonine-protein kinase RsbW
MPMRTGRHLLRFPGTPAGFDQATAALHRVLDDHQMQGAARFDVELAFEEIAINIVRHGAPNGEVEATVAFDNHEVVLTFDDDGVAFDPLLRPDPELPSSIEDAQPGGLGILLVKKRATRLAYERTPQHHNRLTVVLPVR